MIIIVGSSLLATATAVATIVVGSLLAAATATITVVGSLLATAAGITVVGSVLVTAATGIIGGIIGGIIVVGSLSATAAAAAAITVVGSLLASVAGITVVSSVLAIGAAAITIVGSLLATTTATAIAVVYSLNSSGAAARIFFGVVELVKSIRYVYGVRPQDSAGRHISRKSRGGYRRLRKGLKQKRERPWRERAEETSAQGDSERGNRASRLIPYRASLRTDINITKIREVYLASPKFGPRTGSDRPSLEPNLRFRFG
ncbi:hypothetical protein IEO21_02396 [Rhodonia placenta]|uniref:Uncharacterized protein n=1 Tax=Rhodonia placenta TaxID=104341 RepID=A0A8H7P7P5_9APHY|nr:hypothetical protein IEO21_02396 [Postia placenta]